MSNKHTLGGSKSSSQSSTEAELVAGLGHIDMPVNLSPAAQALKFGIDAKRCGALGTYRKRVPYRARHLLEIEWNLGPAEHYADFYLHVPRRRVLELWEDGWHGLNLLARQPQSLEHPIKQQVCNLVLEFLKQANPWEGAPCLSKPEWITRKDWAEIDAQLDQYVKPRPRSEFDDPAGLFDVADEIGMELVHQGRGSELFRGRCPAHIMHIFLLNPAKGNWYCGHCARKGGPEELRAFAAEAETHGKQS